MPLLSIIIPAYNAEKYLNEALDSILCQTFQDWELIIVDDCSTDRTRDIVSQYISQDNRIRLICRTSNSGSARLPEKDGVHAAQGQYVSPVGQDDILDSDYYEKMIERAHCTQADVILSVMAQFSDNNHLLNTIPRQDFDFGQTLDGEEACTMTLLSWNISCNGMLTKKSLLQGILDENDDCYVNSDEVDSRKLLFYATAVAFSDTHYNYRLHQESITHKIVPKLFERLLTFNLLYDFLQSHLNSYYSDTVKALASECINTYISHIILFLRVKGQFSKKQQKETRQILKDAFRGIKCNGIKPSTFKFTLVMQSYMTALLYCRLKYSLEKHKYAD